MHTRKDYKYIALSLTLLLTLPAINYYIAAIYLAYGINNPFSELIYGFTYLVGMSIYFRHFNVYKILSVLSLIALLLISFILTPTANFVIFEPNFSQSLLARLIFIYFPIFLICSEQKFNYDYIISYLYSGSLIVVCLCIIAYIMQIYMTSGLQEYMTFAYTGLPAILICIFNSWKNNRIFGKLLSILASATIFFGGCRGALLTLVVFIILFIAFNIKSLNKFIIVLFICLLFILNIEQILTSINFLLSSLGYESRIMGFLEADAFAESSARENVYAKALSIIEPYGHGLYSDRLLLQRVEDATYCHNWILELCVDFGYILGSILVFIVMALIFTNIKKMFAIQKDSIQFLVIFAISMFGVKYMLSNSYLNSPEIALIIGWFVSQLRFGYIDSSKQVHI